MALKYSTDDELVQMSTTQLRNLLEQNIITPDQHHELRVRRRRLQNRKYARRCVKKKQTEVATLEAETQLEWESVQSLKLQLSRLTVASSRLDDHLEKLDALQERMKDKDFSIPLVTSDGTRLGTARLNPNLLEPFPESEDSRSSSAPSSPSVSPSDSLDVCNRLISPHHSDSRNPRHNELDLPQRREFYDTSMGGQGF